MRRTIAAESFGIHFAAGYTGNVDLGPRMVRLWDNGCTWRLTETSKGVFDWSAWDREIGKARARGAKVMAMLGQPPAWATGNAIGGTKGAAYNASPPDNNQDLADFQTALMTRYPNDIVALGVMNEPSFGGVPSGYYNGTVTQLVEITRVVRVTRDAVNPAVLVVSPEYGTGASTGDLDTFLAACAGTYNFDVVGYHYYIYPQQPEYLMGAFIATKVRSLMRTYGIQDKPLWNTEWTYNTWTDDQATLQATAPVTDAWAAAYIVRHMMCAWLMRADKTFFYYMGYDAASWNKIYLLDSGLVPTMAGQALQYVVGLLSGGKLYNARTHGNWHYSARFETASGNGGRVFWGGDTKTMSFDLSAYKRATDVVGNPVSISANTTIGNSPVFAFE